MGIAPVSPDRLPEPLPENLTMPIVITVQTDGATNFDIPVPVRFPNANDLQPGSKSALWSFNHDTGIWEIAGPMTVSQDGLYLETDPVSESGNRVGTVVHRALKSSEKQSSHHQNSGTPFMRHVL